jgi:hypothetical protein
VMTDPSVSNAGAVLAHLRWDRLSPEQRRATMRQMTERAALSNLRRHREKLARQLAEVDQRLALAEADEAAARRDGAE